MAKAGVVATQRKGRWRRRRRLVAGCLDSRAGGEAGGGRCEPSWIVVQTTFALAAMQGRQTLASTARRHTPPSFTCGGRLRAPVRCAPNWVNPSAFRRRRYGQQHETTEAGMLQSKECRLAGPRRAAQPLGGGEKPPKGGGARKVRAAAVSGSGRRSRYGRAIASGAIINPLSCLRGRGWDGGGLGKFCVMLSGES